MKSKIKLLGSLAFVLGATFAVSCSVDNAYDLSKEVDMTVSVGEGFVIPLGSTEKIMLTELLDTLDSDVVKIDKETGFYSIEEDGAIDATEFDVDVFSIEVEPHDDVQVYDFSLTNLGSDLDVPDEYEDLISGVKFAYVLEDIIDENTGTFEIHEEVPTEVVGIKRITFKEPVALTMDVMVSLTEGDETYSRFIDELHIHTDGVVGDERFYVEIPSFVIIEGITSVNGKNRFYIDDLEEKSISKGVKHFLKTVKLEALDFSRMPAGELLVENGKINIVEDDLNIYGALRSDTVFLGLDNVLELSGVKVETLFKVDEIVVDSVYGRFAPQIDPVDTWVDIDLGDDLDNLNFEFTNPQLFLTVDNGAPIGVNGNVNITGYKDGAPLENSSINTMLSVLPSAVNNFYLSRLGGNMDGYTTVHIPDFNNLIKVVPDRLKVCFEPTVDSNVLSALKLGQTMSVSGDYRLSVPMEFESFSLEYTERVENILGDNSDDITEYITDVNSLTLTVVVDNTVPASFLPTINAYKKDGVTKLDGIKVEVSNEIAAGNGYVDGRLTAPVESEVAIRISATNGQLADLDILDIVVKGSGSGALNVNEYIQIKSISLKIDEPIEVDMN